MPQEGSEKKRTPRMKAIIVAGEWSQDGRFIPYDKQPEPTTELSAAIAWAKANLGPGAQAEFIRKIPGSLTLEPKTRIVSRFG